MGDVKAGTGSAEQVSPRAQRSTSIVSEDDFGQWHTPSRLYASNSARQPSSHAGVAYTFCGVLTLGLLIGGLVRSAGTRRNFRADSSFDFHEETCSDGLESGSEDTDPL